MSKLFFRRIALSLVVVGVVIIAGGISKAYAAAPWCSIMSSSPTTIEVGKMMTVSWANSLGLSRLHSFGWTGPINSCAVGDELPGGGCRNPYPRPGEGDLPACPPETGTCQWGYLFFTEPGTASVNVQATDSRGSTASCGITIYARATAQNNSSCSGISVPSTLTAGQTFSATVTMTNTGTKAWTTDATPHNLGSQNPQDNIRWALGRVGLPFQPVNPGQSATFSFTATAPTTPGTYPFDWRMVEDGVEWFGATCTQTITVTSAVSAGSIDVNAILDGASWPGSVNYTLNGSSPASGTSVPNTFSNRNAGSYSVTYNSGGPAGKNFIGVQTSCGSATCNLVAGDRLTFTLMFQSPTAVSNAASCSGISAPSTLTAGQTFSATVTMTNTGTKAWTTDATPHNLGSQNPQDNIRWALGRVGLPFQPVNPGQSATFSFTATAPTTPGTYPFDWRMVEDGIEWFGQTCTGTIIVNPQASQNITVSGRVFNQTSGAGFAGATITTCRSSPATVNTDSNGNFSFQVREKEGFCVRVSPETRSGFDGGPSLNNNVGLESMRSYEWQVVGWSCATQGGCNADQNTWDRVSDSGYDFKYTASASSQNNSSCSGISVPSTLTAGQTFSATVTMTNTGTKAWTTDATPHNLGSQNPQDNIRWALGRVGLPFQPVNPGQSATFSFTATAPTTPGTYPFDWRMVEDGVEWFGATCTQTITVTSAVSAGGVPGVTTLQASGVSNTFASLQGSVIPNNLSTSAWFEYGASQSLGSTIGVQSVGSGNSATNYSAFVSGLQSNTTYYYRAVAQNSQGTSYGQTVSFSTGAIQQQQFSVIQGYKIDSQGGIFNNPGATVSVIGQNFNQSYGPSANPVLAQQISAGGYTVTSSLPSGYTVSYSLCTNCVDHPASSYVVGTSVSVNAPANGYLDLWWKYTLIGGQGAGSAPIVTTNASTGVTQTSATLQGSVTANNLSTSSWFEYGASVSLGSTAGSQSVGASNNSIAYSYTLSGLQSNTTYYYRAVAQNSQGTSYGQIISFTTQYQQVANYTQPSVSTNAASNVSQTSATLNGSVNPNGSDTTYWFEYGYSQSLGQTVGVQSLGSGSGTQYVSRYVSGLAANGNYYYRIAAQNAGGTVYGSIVSFATASDYSSCAYNNCQSNRPAVQTKNASYVFSNSALLTGSANPNGSVSNSWFEWGPNTALANSTFQQPIGSGNSSLEISYGLSGLQPGTTYYYRAAAQNAYGVERGTILSFSTLQNATYAPPVTYTPPPVVYYSEAPQYVQPIVINQATGASAASPDAGRAVTISLTLNVPEVGIGEEVSLVISYRNDTQHALRDVVLHVALPAEVEYRSANTVPAFQTPDRIDFVIGTVPLASQGAVAIRAHVKDSVSPASALMFNAWLDYRNGSGGQQSVHSFITAPVRAIANSTTALGASASGLTASVFSGVSWGWSLVLLLLLLLIAMLFWLFSLSRRARDHEDRRMTMNGPGTRTGPPV